MNLNTHIGILGSFSGTSHHGPSNSMPDNRSNGDSACSSSHLLKKGWLLSLRSHVHRLRWRSASGYWSCSGRWSSCAWSSHRGSRTTSSWHCFKNWLLLDYNLDSQFVFFKSEKGGAGERPFIFNVLQKHAFFFILTVECQTKITKPLLPLLLSPFQIWKVRHISFHEKKT